MADKRTMWRKRIEAWRRSGESRTAFCAARRLNVHTFDYWRRALRASAPKAALVPVAVKAAPVPATGPAVTLVLANGLRLELAGDCDPARVRSLVEALRPC